MGPIPTLTDVEAKRVEESHFSAQKTFPKECYSKIMNEINFPNPRNGDMVVCDRLEEKYENYLHKLGYPTINESSATTTIFLNTTRYNLTVHCRNNKKGDWQA